MNIRIPKLNRSIAEAAHRGTSFTPERRGESEVAEFDEYLRSVVAEFERYDVEGNPNRAELEADVQRFVDGYHGRTIALLHSESRHVSVMIAGPSGFNTRRHEKTMNAIDNKMRDLIGYDEAVLNRLRTKHDPNRVRPVLSGEADAADKLQERIDKLETLQATMKAANAIIRKQIADDEKIAALVTLDGISDEIAHGLLTPDCFGGLGFPSFELSNNNANIRRLKERLACVQQLHAAQPEEVNADGLTITEDANDNRIRIEFAGRKGHPANEWLKHHGWHWSPRGTCWQRQITANARASAREFVEVYRGLEANNG